MKLIWTSRTIELEEVEEGQGRLRSWFQKSRYVGRRNLSMVTWKTDGANHWYEEDEGH